MFFLDLIAAVLIALIFSMILVGVFGWQRPNREGTGPAMVFLFLLLLVVVWAGGIWMEPVGPIIWGIAWIPFLVIGFLAALVVLAVIPPRRPRTRREAVQQAEAQEKTEAGVDAAISVFFWLLVVLLIVAIIVRYT